MYLLLHVLGVIGVLEDLYTHSLLCCQILAFNNFAKATFTDTFQNRVTRRAADQSWTCLKSGADNGIVRRDGEHEQKTSQTFIVNL